MSELIPKILQYKTIAIVGLSNNPSRDSYKVADYMQQHGYKIIPVNPMLSEVLGEPSYPDLKNIPTQIDVVNLFQRSEKVAPHVDDAIAIGVKVIWMQLDIVNLQAANLATINGLDVVMDKCIKIEHEKLLKP